MRVNAHGLLLPPLPTRNFAISPPVSPPAEWVSREEDGPNMLPHADDLAARLDQLAVDAAGQYCVFDPEAHADTSGSDTSFGPDTRPDSCPGSDRPGPGAGPVAKRGFIIPPIFVIRDCDEAGPESPTGPSLQPPFDRPGALTSSPPTGVRTVRTPLPPLS